MVVKRWRSLAAAAMLAGMTAPAAVFAQDGEPLLRAFEMVGGGTQIGATVSEIEGDTAKQPKAGVVVDTVTPGGPADKAGIKSGDAITEFDGERVRSVRQFSRLVQETSPGHSVPVALSRDGQRVTVNVTPERRSSAWSTDLMRLGDMPRVRIPSTPTPPAPPRALRTPGFGEPFDLPGLRFWNGRGIGVTIESLDDQLAQYFGVKEGVLIKSVQNDSAAQKAGLKAGDVITAIDGRKIYETSDVSRAIDRVQSGGDFTIEIVRDKKPQTLKGKLDASEPRRTRVRTRI